MKFDIKLTLGELMMISLSLKKSIYSFEKDLKIKGLPDDFYVSTKKFIIEYKELLEKIERGLK